MKNIIDRLTTQLNIGRPLLAALVDVSERSFNLWEKDVAACEVSNNPKRLINLFCVVQILTKHIPELKPHELLYSVTNLSLGLGPEDDEVCMLSLINDDPNIPDFDRYVEVLKNKPYLLGKKQ